MSGCCDLSGCVCPPDLSGNIVSTTSPSDSPPESPRDSSTEQEIVESTWGLRLRARMDELSSNLPTPPTPPQIHLNEIYIQSMVYFFRFLNLSAQLFQFLWLLFGNVSRGVKRSFQDEVYIFFKDSSYPYYIHDVQTNQSGIPEIEWYYNAATNTFISSRLYATSQTYHTHHIPYLTAEVRYNDLMLYDISEFINSVRWAGVENGNEQMPNVDHLISAWSISSGIVLKRSEQMNLCVINTDGNEIKVPLRNGA